MQWAKAWKSRCKLWREREIMLKDNWNWLLNEFMEEARFRALTEAAELAQKLLQEQDGEYCHCAQHDQDCTRWALEKMKDAIEALRDKA